MSLNEIACSLGHKLALERFLASGVEHGLILEDDVHIMPTDFARMSALARAVPEFDLLKVGGYLGGLAPGRIAARLDGLSVVAVLSPSVLCARLYRHQARRAQACLDNPAGARTVRCVSAQCHQHKCTIFETSPWLVRASANAAESTIGGSRQPLRATPSLGKTLRSVAFRLKYNVMKRLFNLRRFGIAYITRSGFVRMPG
jgi:glycosyl transferase family 25